MSETDLYCEACSAKQRYNQRADTTKDVRLIRILELDDDKCGRTVKASIRKTIDTKL